MDKAPYVFLGFQLREISFEKKITEDLNEVRISIPMFAYNPEEEILSVGIEVEIDYDESKQNRVLYTSGFQIIHDDLKQDLLDQEKHDEYLPLFLRTVLPFVRENLCSITKDAGTVVMLPTIDCEDITLENTMILTVRES